MCRSDGARKSEPCSAKAAKRHGELAGIGETPVHENKRGTAEPREYGLCLTFLRQIILPPCTQSPLTGDRFTFFLLNSPGYAHGIDGVGCLVGGQKAVSYGVAERAGSAGDHKVFVLNRPIFYFFFFIICVLTNSLLSLEISIFINVKLMHDIKNIAIPITTNCP